MIWGIVKLIVLTDIKVCNALRIPDFIDWFEGRFIKYFR